MEQSSINVFERISAEYYNLTTAEKKAADYVLSHQRKAQDMSITELAAASGVAEATVSRFCRRLGCKGYNAFRLAIANSIAQRPQLYPRNRFDAAIIFSFEHKMSLDETYELLEEIGEEPLN